MIQRMKKPVIVLVVFALLFSGAITYAQMIKPIEWAFTQEKQKPEELLIDLINSSKQSLDIAIYSLTHPDIVKAIKDANKRGVAVRIITDKQQSTGAAQKQALKLIINDKIPIKLNNHSGLMHMKNTIVDNKAITIGSFNYSKAAATTHDEVLMVIRDEEIAKSFAEEFEKMWTDKDRYITYSHVTNETVESTSKTQVECKDPKIKANKNSLIYHVPGGKFYAQTTANIELFCTEKEAEAAGYRKSKQ